ncbi:MAG: LamG-like jellyroll fold domain-containing protein, partial [Nitrosopumilaceae archaeon]
NSTTSTDILESNSTKNELEHKIILPNATESWKFDSYVNGSHFVGNVYVEEESGLMLNGDSYVTNDGDSTNSLSNLTITAWVKPYYSNGSSEFTIVSKERTFELIINNKIDPQHVAKFSIFDGIQWHSVETSTTLGESWSHLAATFNGTKLSVYTNGTLSNEKSTTNTITLTTDGQFEPKTTELISSTSDIVVGASLDNSRSVDDASKKFSGEIYDVNIFDVYLTAAQIAELYNSSFPFILENSNSTNTVEIIEDIPTEELKTIDLLEEISSIGLDNATNTDNISNNTIYNTGIEFNKTQSFVTIKEQELNKDLNQLTISAFIKPNYTAGSAEFTVLSKENSFVLSLNHILSPEHVVKFSVFDGISWTEVVGSSKIENWSHLIAIINDTRISLYVNGTLEGSTQLSEPIFISGDKLQLTTSDVMVSDSDLILGAYLSTTRGESKLSKYFSGLIDEVFIYKEALTESQIQEIYSHFIEQLEPKLELALLLPIELQNTTSTLSHNEIVIGTPVNWIQTIVLNETNENSIQVELPADAENIQAEMLASNDQSLEIPQANLEVTNSLLGPIDLIPLDIVTMEKIDDVLQDNEDTKYLMINESSSEYTLEFETPAPYTIEEDNSDEDMFNKTVTVTHDSALHYTDVQSYSEIPEDLVTEDSEFNLYWNINGTITNVTFDPRFQVEYIDTDDNGIADHIQWNVPQLSQQIFQIIASKKISSNVINVRISQGSDDAEQLDNGNMDLNDKSDLDIAENQIGLRFQNINIPQGSIITKAYIQFTTENDNENDDEEDGNDDKDNDKVKVCHIPPGNPGNAHTIKISKSALAAHLAHGDTKGACLNDDKDDDDHEENSASVIIFAENVDNAKTFSKTKSSDITTRNPTQTSVNWSIPEWKKQGDAGSAQRTPNISTLVQEVVNRKDWLKGNPLVFMLLINNHGNRDAFTYDGNPGKSPLLHIEFSSGQTLKLNGLIRDFKGSHPDFEYIIGDDDGIVKPLLGDGNNAEFDNPAYAHTDPTTTTTGKDNFNQWYKNFENINKCKEFDITLVPSRDGLFKFSDTTFFPIDGKLFGNEGRNHNYHFTYEMRGSFVSKAGQTIQVNGDDDVWIFVNHKLIYDGGGVLPARNSGVLHLDSFGLDLVDGTKYDIDIFFAERHTVQSVFEIETNINIIQKNLSCDAQEFKIRLLETLTLQDTSFNTDQTKQVTL